MAISVCPSLCVSSFFASGGKTVRGICTKFSGCTDPPGGCVFLSFAGVHIARGACHMHVQATSELWILRACRSDVATQKRKTLREDAPFGWLRVFCVGGGEGHTRRPHEASKELRGTSAREIRIRERCELRIPKLVCSWVM